jgi:hypothetical protein
VFQSSDSRGREEDRLAAAVYGLVVLVMCGACVQLRHGACAIAKGVQDGHITL